MTAETFDVCTDTFFILHYPASTGFIAKTGYKASLATEEIINKLGEYQEQVKTEGDPKQQFNFKKAPYNGVGVFANINLGPHRWEEILGTTLTPLPAAR